MVGEPTHWKRCDSERAVNERATAMKKQKRPWKTSNSCPKKQKNTDHEWRHRRRGEEMETAPKERWDNARKEWETLSTINKMPATQLLTFLLKYEGNIKRFSLILLRYPRRRDNAAYLVFKPPLRWSNSSWSIHYGCGVKNRKSELLIGHCLHEE